MNKEYFSFLSRLKPKESQRADLYSQWQAIQDELKACFPAHQLSGKSDTCKRWCKNITDALKDPNATKDKRILGHYAACGFVEQIEPMKEAKEFESAAKHLPLLKEIQQFLRVR